MIIKKGFYADSLPVLVEQIKREWITAIYEKAIAATNNEIGGEIDLLFLLPLVVCQIQGKYSVSLPDYYLYLIIICTEVIYQST